MDTEDVARPADSAAATGCAATGPRLRCLAKDQNCFYGMYKGCTVSILRDHKSRPWTFLISAANGQTLADGFTKESMTLREAIVHAVKGAGLWHNAEVSDPTKEGSLH